MTQFWDFLHSKLTERYGEFRPLYIIFWGNHRLSPNLLRDTPCLFSVPDTWIKRFLKPHFQSQYGSIRWEIDRDCPCLCPDVVYQTYFSNHWSTVIHMASRISPLMAPAWLQVSRDRGYGTLEDSTGLSFLKKTTATCVSLWHFLVSVDVCWCLLWTNIAMENGYL